MKGKPSSRQNSCWFLLLIPATRPNTFWVSLANLDLKPGASVKKLTIQNGEVFSSEVTDQFKDAEPFKFL